MKITILLADDHEMLRRGLTALLKGEAGLEVIAEASDGRTAVRLAGQLKPDVVVMDVNMPELNGIEATRQIRGQGNDTPRVIALSAHADERFAREMMNAGASGYVLKEAAFEELVTAVRLVQEGQTYLSPTVANLFMRNHVRNSSGNGDGGERSSAFSALTSREREVLQLLAEGKATKQAAMHLNVSVKTIETHRRNIMEKLDMYSVAELTKYAIREGLTSLELQRT